MTPDEAAQRAKTTRWSIMRAVKSHALRGTQDNHKRWHISPDDLAMWMAARAPTERTLSAHKSVTVEDVAGAQSAQELVAQVEALTIKLASAEDALGRERETVTDLRGRLDRSEAERQGVQRELQEARREATEQMATILRQIVTPAPALEPAQEQRGLWARLRRIGA